MNTLPGARPGPRARPPLSLPALTVALSLLAAQALAAPPAPKSPPSTPEVVGSDAASAALAASGSGAPAKLTACRVDGVPTEVQCGSLRRPLDPAHPEGRQIDIRFVVVRALARNKLPDPVLLLAGGPGQSAVSLTGGMLPRLSRLNYRRDLVFIDQRGTGRSAPLQCPDNSGRDLEELTKPGAKLRLLEACRVALEKLPYGDLRMFTTTIAMQDMDAVRAALGVERWNLIGASYGTRAALEYQRQFPQHVRRAVIDGVAPPDMVLPASFSRDGQAALDAVFDACAADAKCQAAYPALRAEWQGLLKSLPRKVSVMHPLTGKLEEFTLTREALLGMVRPPLYVPASAAALPAALHAAAQGRFEAVTGLAGQLSSSRGMRLAEGMHFSVICAEDAPRLAQATDTPSPDFGTLDQDLYANACRAWPRGEVPPAFYEIPPVKTPVLVLSGGADPATPPRHGARVAKALGPSAVHVVVPQAGHGVAMSLGCMRDVVYRFFDAPQDADALRVDASCAQRIPRPTPYLPPTAATVAAAASAARESDR